MCEQFVCWYVSHLFIEGHLFRLCVFFRNGSQTIKVIYSVAANQMQLVKLVLVHLFHSLGGFLQTFGHCHGVIEVTEIVDAFLSPFKLTFWVGQHLAHWLAWKL